MKSKLATFSALTVLLLGSAQSGDYSSKQPVNPKQPVDSRGVVGEIGLGLGWNWIDEDDGDGASVYLSTINGSVAFPVGNFYIFALDAYARYDDFSDDADFDSNEDPEFEYSFGAHFLRDMSADTRLGFFTAYGDTRPQDWDKDDSYDVLMGGVEYQHFVSDKLLLFTQLGYGRSLRDGEDSTEAFGEGGFISRAGGTYFVNEQTALTLDFEAAFAAHYVDSDDAGLFYGVTLGGETQLSEGSPLYLTYFARYDFIDATDDGWIEDVQAGVGIKYLFGAGSSKEAARAGKSIGTPRMPIRGSAWTE